MRKIKSCPANLALLKNNKQVIVKESVSNQNINLDQIVNKKKSRFFLNILNDNDIFPHIFQYEEADKSINYFIEFLTELLKNQKINKDKLFQLIFNIIFRYLLYMVFHHSDDILNFKIIIIHDILKITN